MTSLSKFLVLFAIFLSASLGDAFDNSARLNHLIRFDASMSYPMNEPSRVSYRDPTSDRMNGQTTTSNTSYTFEAANGVNHNHNKIKVDNQVTLQDSQDYEIQRVSRKQSKIQSDREGPKHREVSRSGFSTICPFGGLSYMVHSHAVKVPITLSNILPAGVGLRLANSRAGCIASVQTCELCHNKTYNQQEASLPHKFKCQQKKCKCPLSKPKQTMPYPLAANQSNLSSTGLHPYFSLLLHLFRTRMPYLSVTSPAAWPLAITWPFATTWPFVATS